MKTRGNDWACPQVDTDLDLNSTSQTFERRVHSFGGLTKREYFAAMAMQGILANANWQKSQINDPERLGQAAVLYADGLVNGLNVEQS